MFEGIREEVARLQSDYETGNFDRVAASHAALMKTALALAVRSSLMARGPGPVTAEWSEIGTEGASAIVKAVELARIYDSRHQILSPNERRFLLLVAALEFYRCGRHGVAAALLRRPDATLPSSLSASPVTDLATVLHSFCGSKFEDAWLACQRVKQKTAEFLQRGPPSDGQFHALESLAVAAFCHGLLLLRDHLQSAQLEPLAEGRVWIQKALEMATASRDVELELLLQAFERAYDALLRLTLWNLLGTYWPEGQPDNLVRSWITHKLANSQPFLFPSQQEALIERRILDQPHSLVSMPTGGGKSLLAEAFALKILQRNPAAKVLLIVPSRALANEKREALQEAFGWEGSPIRVCQMTGDAAFDLKEAYRGHSVIVATPEKFDILLRSGFFECPPDGLVVDEFHTIKTQYRGLKLQLAIARFSAAYRKPVLYISAIVRETDFEALGRWARSPDPFSTRWKPTPTRIGLVDLDTRPWTIAFSDGITKRIKAPPKLRANATRRAAISIAKEFLREDQVLHFNMYVTSYGRTNALIELAEAYMADLPEMPYLNDAARQKLGKEFERLIGEDHPVSKAFRAGIAVHWGELPHVARRLVERGIRDKALGLVIATSTLAEGVNLPLRTVFIPKLRTRNREMEIGQFLNIVGRAGRPFLHPEGQVVVASSEAGREDYKTPQSLAWRFVKASSSDIEALTTAANYPARLLQRAKQKGLWSGLGPAPHPRNVSEEDENLVPELLAEIESFSSSLLASISEGLISSVVGDGGLESVLFIGTETNDQKAEVRSLLQVINGRLLGFEVVSIADDGRLTLTEWGRTVYRCGFGPESCGAIREKMRVFLPQFLNFVFNPRLVFGANNHARFFDNMLELLPVPRELRRMGRGVIGSMEKYLLRGWVGGVPTAEIARRSQEINGDYLLAFTRIEGLVSTYSSWVFYAASLIATQEFGEKEITKRMTRLARMAWYGHFDSRLMSLMKRDVNRELLRDDVIALYEALGERFQLLLDGNLTSGQIELALRGGRLRTRLPERQVAEVAFRLGRIAQEE